MSRENGEAVMNRESIEGKVKNGLGKAEQASGEVLGDPGMRVRRESRQIEGAAEDAVAKAREALEQTVKKAREVVSEAAEQAADTYQNLRKQAQGVAHTV